MSMNRPVISVLGFVTINKGTVKSYASTLVTYMIVLLQFSMGQHKPDNNCNVLQNTTETN
nr:gustatory receptor 9 [Odontotermes formosanus]